MTRRVQDNQDPKYESEWEAACAQATGGDIVERMDIWKTEILMDYNSKYQDKLVMCVTSEQQQRQRRLR